MLGRDRMQSFEARVGLSPLGATTIVAIVLVLVLVSLPRLRGYATSANEEDAITTSMRLARALAQVEAADGAVPRLETVARDHLRELDNAEFLEAGARMRRHGYLFTLCEVPRPTGTGFGRVVQANEPEPLLAVLAWPWDAGRTGRSAWVATVEGDLLAHRNRSAAWSGPRRGVEAAGAPRWSWEGWELLRDRSLPSPASERPDARPGF